MAKFYCNLANTRIKNIQFHNHYYETEDPEEIKFLRNYGAQQGCVITEVIEKGKADNKKTDEDGKKERAETPEGAEDAESTKDEAKSEGGKQGGNRRGGNNRRGNNRRTGNQKEK